MVCGLLSACVMRCVMYVFIANIAVTNTIANNTGSSTVDQRACGGWVTCSGDDGKGI